MKFRNARGRVSRLHNGQSYKSPDSFAERRSGSGDPFAQLTCVAQSDSRKFAFALCTSDVAPPSQLNPPRARITNVEIQGEEVIFPLRSLPSRY